MGLNSKESVIVIKEEATEGCKDSPGKLYVKILFFLY